jgi:protease I
VTSVASNSPAAKAGLVSNDIITTLDTTQITDDQQFQKELELRLARQAKYTILTIRRGNGYLKTALKPFYDLSGKKIALVLPEKDSEYFELIKRILIENGAIVTIVSQTREIFIGKDQKIRTECTISELGLNDYQGIIFVGGLGAQAYWHDETVYQLVRNAVKEKKAIGAIGAASIILINAESELLKKKITTDQDYSKVLLEMNATYTGSKVERDGNIVTTTGFDAEAIKAFLKEYKTALRGKQE